MMTNQPEALARANIFRDPELSVVRSVRSRLGFGLVLGLVAWCSVATAADPPRGYSIPLIDLAKDTVRQVVVDREPGQCLGHAMTYGHWTPNEQGYVVSVRLKLSDLDHRP